MARLHRKLVQFATLVGVGMSFPNWLNAGQSIANDKETVIFALHPAGDTVVNGNAVQKCEIIRITLDRQNKLGKESILTTDALMVSPNANHEMVGGKYLVSSSGTVIDVVTKKIIHSEQTGHLEARPSLLNIDGRHVIYWMNLRRKNGIFQFDLDSHRLSRLDDHAILRMAGVVSPDKKHSVDSRYGALVLHRTNGTTKMTLLDDCRIDYSPLAPGWGVGVPCLWLDNRWILTQKANGLLVRVSTDRQVEEYVRIKDAPLVAAPPTLEYDPGGRIIYTCANDVFVISPKSREVARLKWYDLGNGFEESVDTVRIPLFWMSDGLMPIRMIRFQGRSLGLWSPTTYVSRPGMLVIGYRDVGDLSGSIKGVAMWSEGIREWRTLEIRLDNIIVRNRP